MPQLLLPTWFRNLKLRGKILSLVAFLIAIIGLNAAITLWKLEVIGAEVADVAELDLPITQAVTRFAVNQLEQGLQFERGVAQRMTALGVQTDAERFREARGHFAEYGEKAVAELHAANEVTTDALRRAHSDEQREKLEAIRERLSAIAERHQAYEGHTSALLDGDGDEAAEEFATRMNAVHEEQDALDHELEAALAELGGFTHQSADNVEADEQRAVILIASLSLAGLTLGIGFGLIMAGALARPLARAVETVKALAAGDTSVELRAESEDEVGMLAKTIEVFRKTTIRANQLAEAQQAEEARRLRRLEKQAQLVRGFDEKIGVVLETVSSASAELHATAESLTAIAERTATQSKDVASGSQEASANVQTVAAAAEELSNAIAEISEQVVQSTAVASAAASQASDADRDMKALNDTAERIGEIIVLIQEIAEQTNLLALNATIEAARAGEMGKGFAVVANEVKTLATQTAKATDDITRQIGDMQTATQGTVRRIQEITATISGIQNVSTSIASAVEEQTAATQEIARNVDQAATGTAQVDRNITGVSASAEETGSSAKDVLEAADQVARQAANMKTEVQDFLDGIRALDDAAAA
jgi:methyl-accepting chemotaxis protein